MGRSNWLGVALALGMAPALMLAGRPAAAEVPTVAGAPSYQALGKLPVQHEGRDKPLDTVAREEVKQIYGREIVQETDPKSGKPVAKWPAVAALFDWSVRPEFWDDQPIILVEYLPLKRLLLADAVKGRLDAIAARPATPETARARSRVLARSAEISAAQLRALAQVSGLADDDRRGLEELAARLGEENKYLTPREFESAQVTVEGKRVPFATWLQDLAQRNAKAHQPMARTPKLAGLEKKAFEAGTRLRHYQAIRDNGRGMRNVAPPDAFLPRPHGAAAMAFTSAALKKLRDGEGRSPSAAGELTDLEQDALNALSTYFKDLQIKDRKEPGTDAAADARYGAWLRDTADWLALSRVLAASDTELERFGFPAREVADLRASYHALREAELAVPGQIDVEKATRFVSAARALGEAVGGYPTVAAMDREVHFNALAPFYKAPVFYGSALLLLLLGLGITADRRSALGALRQALYAVGLAAFAGGIGIEIIGFVYRVRITGWAPVTGMYETVIWVALVTSVLGLVLEAFSRKGYVAGAASGVALLATTLAATSPSLLDPDIKNLNPVLRSNYWLTIHVLTIVSSYAAFALAMGLGLVAVGIYLTATYKRAVGYGELARPLLPGLPLLGLGAWGLVASLGETGWASGVGAYYLAASVAGAGGMLTIVGVFGVIGEFISRSPLQGLSLGLPILAGGSVGAAVSLYGSAPLTDPRVFNAAAAVAGMGFVLSSLGLLAILGNGSTRPLATEGIEPDDRTPAPAATSVQTVTVNEGSAAVSTASKPTIDEIRARAAASRPKLDARGQAMQRTAARIKPLANFVYRAMQVGVLLVAAGTILGGVWADYSWGRFWGWDPKEVWALITLLVYLVPLHGRFAGWVNTFGLVVASVACFLSVLMAWYGVNFVLGVGLHSYGFVEGKAQGSVVTTTAAVLAVVGATAWRRRLAQQRVA